MTPSNKKPMHVARGRLYGFAAGLAVNALMIGGIAFTSSVHGSLANNEVTCNARDITRNAEKAADSFWLFMIATPIIGALGGGLLAREQKPAPPSN